MHALVLFAVFVQRTRKWREYAQYLQSIIMVERKYAMLTRCEDVNLYVFFCARLSLTGMVQKQKEQ